MSVFKIGDKVSFVIDSFLAEGTIVFIEPMVPESYLVSVESDEKGWLGHTKNFLAENYNLRLDPDTRYWWVYNRSNSMKLLQECVQAKVIHPSAALTCEGCGDINPYAVANLSNGKFACYSCRTSNGWKFK